MAKSMKQADKKNYNSRCRSSFKGATEGVPIETTNKSKFLAIQYDYKHNHIPLVGEKKKIYDKGLAKGW